MGSVATELKLVIASRRMRECGKEGKRKLINSNRSGVSRKKVPCAGDEWSRISTLVISGTASQFFQDMRNCDWMHGRAGIRLHTGWCRGEACAVKVRVGMQTTTSPN